MISVITPYQDAIEIAADVLAVSKKRPVLAFVPIHQWERVWNRDGVDCINDSESGGELETFAGKSVVFCHYWPHEKELMSELERFWRRVLGGDAADIAIERKSISKTWLLSRVKNLKHTEKSEVRTLSAYLSRLPIVPDRMEDGCPVWRLAEIKEAVYAAITGARSARKRKIFSDAFGEILKTETANDGR